MTGSKSTHPPAASDLHALHGTGSPLHAQLTGDDFALEQQDELAWIEVIQKMDTVYAELIDSQTALEHKNAELEEAQSFISSVLSSMTDVLIVCDRQGVITKTNRALSKLTGLDANALPGSPLDGLFHDASKELLSKLISDAKGDKGLSDIELSILDIAGKAVPLSINCSHLCDHRGHVIGHVLIGRPLGELQKAYRELDKAHQSLRDTQHKLIVSEKMAALGRLVAGVAHELNNPISFIFGNMHALKSYGERITRYLQVVEKKSENKELAELRKELKIKRIMDDILPLCEGTLEGAERVSDIVQELRRFSSSQREDQEEFLLLPVIQTASNWVLRGNNKRPDLTIDCSEELTVYARKGYVHQILVNLIQNAIDALDVRFTDESQDEASIAISCGINEKTDNRVTVSICDNGHGIPTKDLIHIFEPFYTTRPIGQGTGLGLYVSYNMAEDMGGSLSASNNEPCGAKLVLTVPHKAEAADSGDTSARPDKHMEVSHE
ncbi:ATP-binding protein [uncultured Cohaesibacter sp.]|uniref:ATP-binding protein n=1 Tax=uncultured Cohaesibacter sp. TaxID=1002546 RepID=UPI0029C8843C|nr:ATP-binding protein [uncultured Cohaesibacter sp.]